MNRARGSSTNCSRLILWDKWCFLILFLSLLLLPSSQVCPAVALTAFQVGLGGIKVKSAPAEHKDKRKEDVWRLHLCAVPLSRNTTCIPYLACIWNIFMLCSVIKVTVKPGSVLRDQSLSDTFILYQPVEESYIFPLFRAMRRKQKQLYLCWIDWISPKRWI